MVKNKSLRSKVDILEPSNVDALYNKVTSHIEQARSNVQRTVCSIKKVLALAH